LGADMKGIFLYEATPLTSLHLHSARRGELKTPGTMATVRAFIAVALVVLLVASINFMNLATVRATRRAREVGVRKAIGASRYHVMVQFLGEALLLTTLAVLLGVMLAELLLPPFNALIGRELDLDLVATAWLLPVLIIGLTAVAGAYPAFYLASFNAAKVLRGSDTGAASGQWFRKALVVFQFSAAVALLIAAWVIDAQLRHVRNVDLGYARENVVVLDNIGAEGVGRNWDLLKQQLLMHPDIVAVTASNSLPTGAVGAGYYFEYDGGADSRTMPVALVDFDYFETFGIPFVAGRAFSRDFASDVPAAGRGGAFVLNESAVRQLGWTPEQALGQRVGLTCCGMEDGIVVGVARDVQHGSVHAPRGPIVYVIPPEPVDRIHSETRLGLQRIALKLSGNNLEDTLAYIDATWKARRPEQAMSLAFLDEKLAGLYLNEERQGRVLAAFALLAIVITCMGLYGLSSYNALLRTKEIGVRKVMGGSVWSIVLLLTNDFSKLVLLSNLIAWPLAYVAMERWLQTFAYRIDLAPLIFIGSGLIALCIAWVTVGGTAAKAANAKPVLALRYE
ncbi:MAG: FtsX-like permease family protein, partial [Pseudomonadota bacterium]|nr:FtsX-like permease family protein [Pseudomonadota bacterium]